jgi:biotin carboxyl carrier protein
MITDKNTSYKVKANAFEFSFTKEEIAAADIVKKSPGIYHIIKDHISVMAKVVAADMAAKKLTIEVAGEKFEIAIKDKLDLVLAKMGFGLVNNKQIKEIKAPMPGLVLEIAVANGQAVTEGDKILILEAMKMENSIVIHTNAIIKRVAVSAGQAVEKGQLLVELE